ncbi:coiled-coil domain-containing protein 103 [Corythoichthys intestinalis]|uniref:coiled-coil domain-containing protein 103 n=1 Tax=Corythoichthys intestinalis TaxID=161448 RepID=UPI0025A5FAC1|nr:coiled-coil domain-containing protein 103 [Corythoichthys intestinalis]XP_057673135.1 coiled-coil domain-containing protein 103 [Corythoichthys intestinalis]XP_057673136.1 coiled-coil domain-containing protein 103 [Corythoichthys intestinalis]XP_057673137.1 coiled-coil domain-containing protein 103 [Corythoichthys intestinalis]XP_057673138.1 coiled-coil domain-containing protein 103 [Corythoichthys intestinalis]
MASSQSDVIDFSALEKDLRAGVESELKYRRENDAKLRAVRQGVPSYQHFRDLVLTCHLTPLDKNDKNRRTRAPWNPMVAPGDNNGNTADPQ